MKFQEFNFENKQIVQIYINKKEQENSEVIKKIEELKKKNSNISIFISGENETTKIIKEMLHYEKCKKVK